MSLVRNFMRQRKINHSLRNIKNKIVFEPLEPRVLLSSDTLSAAAGAVAMDLLHRLDDDGGTESYLNDIDLLEPSQALVPSLLFTAEDPGRESSSLSNRKMVFVDPSVTDYESLLVGIAKSDDLDVVVLDRKSVV